MTGVLPKFEQYHGVHYAPEVAERAVALADRWITDRPFPDKALDLVDELGGAARMNREAGNETPIEVGVQKLPELVARMARIPAEQISESEHGELAALDKVIRSAVFGQDEAIDRIVSAIRVSRSGLGNPERPVGSFLFTGPTGVGKTEVAAGLRERSAYSFFVSTCPSTRNRIRSAVSSARLQAMSDTARAGFSPSR